MESRNQLKQSHLNKNKSNQLIKSPTNLIHIQFNVNQ